MPARKTAFTTACALALLVESPTAHAQSAADTVIVFDGSGSMWGRVGGGESGLTKIEVARETLSDVLGGIDDATRLGLVAYGHQFPRRAQNCSDIQTMVPVGPAQSTVPAMLDAARSIEPKGMTPLTDAVRVAAEGMRYTERPATVVLITDGIETCDADPCALGAELERFGIDFTAHVVGFGLDAAERAQVQCLADNTGGTYFDASNAAGLQTALADALVPLPVDPVEPPEPELTIPPEVAVFLWADPAKTRLLEAGRNGFDYARLYRADALPEGWSPADGFPDAPQVDQDIVQFFARPDGQRLIPEVIMQEPQEGDYVLVSRFSGINEPTHAASTIEVRPGMDAVVDAVAGIAYIEPDMLTGDGQEMSTGSGSIRDPRTGGRLSYGYTSRAYFPVVNGVRGRKSAVSGKLGPIPAGKYEMVLQVGGAVHRERITIEPGDDYRPKVVIDPIVTARLEVIDNDGEDLNDDYKTYVTSCEVAPRDADGKLTGCGVWGDSSITQARGATFFRPGPQVVVFRSDYANVQAERVVDIPADATADSFTITMRPGQKADVGGGGTDGTGPARLHLTVVGFNGEPVTGDYQMNICEDRPRDGLGRLTGCGPRVVSGLSIEAPVGEPFIIGAWNGGFGASNTVTLPATAAGRDVDVTIKAGQKARQSGPPPDPAIISVRGVQGGKEVGEAPTPDSIPEPLPIVVPDPDPVPAPPSFGSTAPALPKRVFLRVHDGEIGEMLLNVAARGQRMADGRYEGTWVYRAEDMVAPNASTLPFLSGDAVVDGPIPPAFGGTDDAPASHPTLATAGAMPAGDYVAVSTFESDGERMVVRTPFTVAPGTPAVIDLVLGVGMPVEPAPAAPPVFGGPTPDEPTDDERASNEEANEGDETTSEVEERATGLAGALARVTVSVEKPDGEPITSPFTIVLCEDRARDENGRLRGCGDEVASGETIQIETGRPVIVGAWDPELFGASKRVVVPLSAEGANYEVTLRSDERARP